MGRPDSGRIDWSAFDELIHADRIELQNSELEHRRQFGIGGAMVGHLPKVPGSETSRYAGSGGHALPINAMVRFDRSGSDARLEIRNLMQSHEARVDGRPVPLNADWAASLGYLYRYSPKAKDGFAAMLRPSKWDSSTYLYELAPYDPDKIPVVLSHGLMSTPEMP